MSRRPASTALVAVLAAVLALVVAPTAAAEVDRERVIVQVRDGDPGVVAQDVARRHAGQVGNVFRHAVAGFSIELPSPAVAALRSDPRIETVEPDHPVRAFEVPTGISRTAIDTNPTADIDGDGGMVDVDIAILDTGIDSTHDEELDVVGGVDCRTGRCVEEAIPFDVHGHGTHVAGTAAAIDGGRVVGAAPGARLWSVKVLNDDGNTLSIDPVLAAMEWLVQNADEIEVANASFGCACSSRTLDEAVTAVADAGVVLVVAAGNAGEDVEGHAMTAHPDVITVSAMADLDGQPGGQAPERCSLDPEEDDDTFASFSSHGDEVDLAAPGVCITSTWRGGGYALSSGTSMAAPHVAGAAALYIVENEIDADPSRSTTVRDGLTADWSASQSGDCGFDGGVSDERMLYLADCGETRSTEVEPDPSIGRLAGADRIATGIEISREVFADGADTAVIAHAGDFPDALAATPLAVALEGPVLLNARDHLHPDVAAELDRLGASTVHLMGGTAVQTGQVEEDLRARGLDVVRVAGGDRFATAAAAADAAVRTWDDAGVDVAPSAVLALGTDFPDALSGGALAATRRAPLLLTAREHLPGATSDALKDLESDAVTIMGGNAAVSEAVASQLEREGYEVDRVAGGDRFHTAVAAADASVDAGARYRSVLIASGRSFPDALTGAPAIVSREGVLLLSERDDLPDASYDALRDAGEVNWVRLAGGTAVLTDDVRDEAAEATGIEP